jgi:hypothetical protein
MVLSGCGKSAVRIGVSLHLLEFSKTYVGYGKQKEISNMGSGSKFRSDSDYTFIAFGLAIIPKGEHALSIHINLVFWHFYFGFGKGYDE